MPAAAASHTVSPQEVEPRVPAAQEQAPGQQVVSPMEQVKLIPALPEPKLVRSQDLSPLLIESMDEFNQSLQCWTQMMENQVKDLSQSFSALNRLSSAAPRHKNISLMVSCSDLQQVAPQGGAA